MNKANRVKFLLGMIVMTSFAAITAGANAASLNANPAQANIISQAKLDKPDGGAPKPDPAPPKPTTDE